VCYCVVAAVTLSVFASCAEAHNIPRVARCNHDEVQQMVRLSTRAGGVETQPQLYVNNTPTTIGPIRFGVFPYTAIDDSRPADMVMDYKMACSAEGDDIYVKGRPYKCEKADVVSEVQVSLILELVNSVNKYLADVFHINNVVKLVIDGGDYNGLLSIQSTGEGGAFVNSLRDIYIAVTFRPDSWDVYASGTSLVYDQNGRPILGLLNWNPRNINVVKSKVSPRSLYERVAIHEILHILGFSQSRMLNFHNISTMDSTTVNSDPYEEIPVIAVTHDFREQSVLRTPKVREAFRELIGCEDAEGAILEDQGGNEVAGSHWEMSVFMDELMTATVSERSVLSNVTLAAMEDSGWYYVNYTAAMAKSDLMEPVVWCRKKGCDFVFDRCNSSWPRGDGFFCTNKGAEDCTYNRRGIGTCDLRYWSVIPEKYRYMGDTHTGGPVDYADFCPFTYPTFFCDEKASNEASSYGDVTGTDSRCFISTLSDSPDGSSKQKSAAKCYPRHCLTNESYAVKIGNYWYPCPTGGEIKEIISFSGTLLCANASLICFNENEDTSFPVFTSIDPPSAEAGTTVRIFGRNIAPDATITLGAPCEDIEVNEAEGSISCTIKMDSEFSAEAGVKNVIIKQNGYSLAVPNAFTLELSPKAWILKNWFIVACAGIGVVVLIVTFLVICCKCCSTSKKWKVYQEAVGKAKKNQKSSAFTEDVEFESFA